MTDTLVILGRQPALGLAELESVYGAQTVQPVGSAAALVQTGVDFNRLGGAVKCAELLESVPITDWRQLETQALKLLPSLVAGSEGKLRLGLSAYGFSAKPAQVEAFGLSLKRAAQKAGRSVRLVPNKTADLSSAQTFHNRLTSNNGLELVLVRDAQQTFIGRVTAVQDINAYTLRDRGRPKRDSRVGMLPPKLAQIIVNLAVANEATGTLLDPFCGTGVVLQEALLMGYDVYGTDLEPRMIDFSGENLDWLDSTVGFPKATLRLEQADATAHRWDPTPEFVAGETYLGRPFTTTPSSELLAQTVSEVDLILKKFLKNIQPQLKAGTRLCLAVPAWQIRPGQFRHLPLIDRISDFGYNRVKFEFVQPEQLLYYRADQLVARELLVLQTIKD